LKQAAFDEITKLFYKLLRYPEDEPLNFTAIIDKCYTWNPLKNRTLRECIVLATYIALPSLTIKNPRIPNLLNDNQLLTYDMFNAIGRKKVQCVSWEKVLDMDEYDAETMRMLRSFFKRGIVRIASLAIIRRKRRPRLCRTAIFEPEYGHLLAVLENSSQDS